jgi:TatD DNase family protein
MPAPPPQLIDIGVNLTHRSFANDWEAVVDRAAAAGVAPLILTGTSLRGSQAAADLARRRPGRLFSTAGVHPHDARNCTPATLTTLRELVALPEVVAIGECGLDYNRDFSPRPVQDRWFVAQVELACDLRLPLFLHERDAYARFMALLTPYQAMLPPAVVHCFTGSAAELDAYLDFGCYIGITGWICDERRGRHLRDLVSRIPLNRLMLETDAPFLTPRTIQPPPAHGRNEPALLPAVLTAVAAALGRPPAEVAAATTATAHAFFNLPATR